MHLIASFPSVVYWRPYYSWNLITNDPDDNKFVDCAIAANAEYIITEDKHFDILHTIGFPQVVPISAMDFINQHLK